MSCCKFCGLWKQCSSQDCVDNKKTSSKKRLRTCNCLEEIDFLSDLRSVVISNRVVSLVNQDRSGVSLKLSRSTEIDLLSVLGTVHNDDQVDSRVDYDRSGVSLDLSLRLPGSDESVVHTKKTVVKTKSVIPREVVRDHGGISLELTLAPQVSNEIVEDPVVDVAPLRVNVPDPDPRPVNAVPPRVNVPVQDPWPVRKKLTASDIGTSCRLMLPRGMVEKQILANMNEDDVLAVQSRNGKDVTLFDMDNQTEDSFKFRLWGSSKCYCLNGGWTVNFVKERNMKVGDTVGLMWDQYRSRFSFSIIERALRN